MNAFPSKIKIGALTYTVREFESEDDLESLALSSETILSDATDTPRAKARMLLVDTLRILSHETAMRNKVVREDAVYAFGAGLAAVWRDNPEAMAWIGEALSGEDPPEIMHELPRLTRGMH